MFSKAKDIGPVEVGFIVGALRSNQRLATLMLSSILPNRLFDSDNPGTKMEVGAMIEIIEALGVNNTLKVLDFSCYRFPMTSSESCADNTIDSQVALSLVRSLKTNAGILILRLNGSSLPLHFTHPTKGTLDAHWAKEIIHTLEHNLTISDISLEMKLVPEEFRGMTIYDIRCNLLKGKWSPKNHNCFPVTIREFVKAMVILFRMLGFPRDMVHLIIQIASGDFVIESKKLKIGDPFGITG